MKDFMKKSVEAVLMVAVLIALGGLHLYAIAEFTAKQVEHVCGGQLQ